MPCATRAGKFPCSSSDDIQRLPLRVSVTVVQNDSPDEVKVISSAVK
jgi:hypothetical protein